jgi:spermidine synthase
VLNVTIGFIILFLRLMPASRNRVWRFVLPVMLVLTVVSMSRTPLDFQFPSQGELGFHQTLYYREGPLATTKVFQNPSNKIKDMSIDGIIIGGNGSIEFKQFLLAHLPKLLSEDVSTELSVGLGSGILAGESSLHPRVRKITSVEIESSVIEGARLFAEENHNVLENPRSEIVLDDIGNFLRTTDDLYQVITADEKTAEDFASNGFSYSLEYYELLRRHLAPGGMVAQWVPAELQSKRFKMVLKTFSHSFPHMQLWYFLPAHQFGLRNVILIGSNEPISIDPDFISRQLAENPGAFKSLLPYGLTSAEAVLPHFVADEKYIRDAVEGAPLNSLVYPRFEFFIPGRDDPDKGEIPITTHELIIQLKSLSSEEYLADLTKDGRDNARIKASIASENYYLLAYQKYLEGISLQEMYQLFDQSLAMAPWNDSLRAQIYAQYSNAALKGRTAAERVNMMIRANSLYELKQGQ